MAALLSNYVENTAGCWIWQGSRGKNGYGVYGFRKNGRATSTSAHRAMWEAVNGHVPKRLQVCHKCDVPLCVNPAHMFLGTPKENCADRGRKGRTARITCSEATAKEIFLSAERGDVVGKRLGIDPEIVRDIRQRKKYRWATEGLRQPKRANYRLGGRLTAEAVKEIRTTLYRGSGVHFAKKYGITPSMVSQIRSGLQYVGG